MRRLEAGDSGLQLRQEEDETMAGVANAASYNQGAASHHNTVVTMPP